MDLVTVMAKVPTTGLATAVVPALAMDTAAAQVTAREMDTVEGIRAEETLAAAPAAVLATAADHGLTRKK